MSDKDLDILEDAIDVLENVLQLHDTTGAELWRAAWSVKKIDWKE